MSEWWSYRLADFLLFSSATYYRLIELYLRDLWPARFLWLGAGLTIVLLLHRGGEHRGRIIMAILAAAWLWVAWAFHLRRYATINWAATWFGAAWAIEAALILWTGVIRAGVRFRPAPTLIRLTGLGLLLFAIAGQPVVDRFLRGGWAGAGGFGLMPDPTVVATLGVLLLTTGSRWILLPIPVLWCVVGGATLLAMEEPDAWVTPLGGLVALMLLARRGWSPSEASEAR